MSSASQFVRHVCCTIAALLLSGTAIQAQSPFDGTWRIETSQSRFSSKPMVTFLSEGWFHCQSCNPKLDIKADGTDQAVVGQAYDTISVREVDSKTVQIKIKKAGAVVMEETQSVSRDGRTLNVKTLARSSVSSPLVTAETTAVRVGVAPAGINAISGVWRIAGLKESDNGLTMTYRSNGDELTMTQADGESYKAKFDGRDYPVEGTIGHNAVTLRRVDNNTFEETDKRDGNIVNIERISISSNGKKMTIVDTNKLTERTTTYIATRR